MNALKSLELFDEISEPVVGFTDDGHYVYANSSALDLFEVPDVHGRSIRDFSMDSVDRFERCEESRSSERLGECLIRSATGRVTRIRFRTTRLYLPEVRLAVMFPDAGLARGTAERKRPRADLFEAVFDLAFDPLLLVDDNRWCVDGNRAARNFLGMSREALVSTRLDDLTPPAARPSLDGIWSTFLKVGTMQRRYPMLLGNGLQRTVIFRARANVRPGRHLSTFQLAQPGYIEVGDTPVEVELTSREREVLTRLARGSNAIAIAEVATLSPETIRTHTRNAMRKLGAHSRPHAIALAIKQRQIDP